MQVLAGILPLSWRQLALTTTVLGSAVLAACGDSPFATASSVLGPSYAVNTTVTKVTVTPTSASVGVGSTLTLQATAYNESGKVVATTFGWASNNQAAATVSHDGVVTGVAPGSSIIKVGSNGHVAALTVTVTASSTVSSTATAASVALTPSPASVAVGSTVQLSATVKDATGAILTGRPLTWSTNAPTVALVGSTGVVTGLLAGSAVVTATVDGKTATSSVTVTSSVLPPPPPPPPSPPPTTVGVRFVDGFESGYAAKQNNAGWSNTAPQNILVSTDVAHAGTHSLRFTFPGKADCLDASAEQRFTLGGNMQEVWIEYYIYFPAGGEGGSAPYYHRSQYNTGCSASATADNNKFLAVFGPNYAGETTGIICTWTTTKALSVPPAFPGDSRIQSSYSKAGMGGIMPNIANYDPFIRGAGDRGRWIQVRTHFRVADFGQSNGVIEMWKDGVLILSNTALPWYDSTNQANYITQGYVLGWANSGFAQTTNIYVDDFRIIDQYPGW